jgi:membrane fusion protein, heavy metal efflux system
MGTPVVAAAGAGGRRSRFAKRPVVLGRRDAGVVEVVSGLRPGEIIAVSNTFPLKAELLKALAEE